MSLFDNTLKSRVKAIKCYWVIDYKKFVNEDSQGKAINKYIKKYKYEKAEQLVDVSIIKEQVEKIKNGEN